MMSTSILIIPTFLLQSNNEEILLQELEQLLSGLQIVGELTPRASDLLSSFGERMSTRYDAMAV